MPNASISPFAKLAESSQVLSVEAALRNMIDCIFMLDHDWRFTSVNGSDQVEFFRGAGRIVGQGHYFGYPVPAGEIFSPG